MSALPMPMPECKPVRGARGVWLALSLWAVVLAAVACCGGVARAQDGGAWLSVMGGELWSPLELNPIAWYQGDGEALDSSGNGHHGTWVGTESYAKGKVGSGFELDGASMVSCGTNFTITTELTICAWVKPTAEGMFPRIAGAENRWIPYIYLSNLCFYGSGVNAPMPGAGVELNTNTFITVRYKDGENIRAYINGMYKGEITKTGALSALTGTPITIGNRTGGDRSFTGTIDDILIFDRALTPVEIAQLYNASKAQYGAPWGLPPNPAP